MKDDFILLLTIREKILPYNEGERKDMPLFYF